MTYELIPFYSNAALQVNVICGTNLIETTSVGLDLTR